MIYLDNAASAPVLDCALSAAEPFLRDCWGNPSSIHTEGRRAALALIEAREKCARAIGAAPEEIVFTSGGTESDNMAVKSAATWRPGRAAACMSAQLHTNSFCMTL